MSGSVLDVAVKFEKIENLELSEQACNFLKTLFGGTIPMSLIMFFNVFITQLVILASFYT